MIRGTKARPPQGSLRRGVTPVQKRASLTFNNIIDNLNKNSQLRQRLQCTLNKLKKNQNIIVTKAGKGGKAVVKDVYSYREKMGFLLTDEDAYKILQSDTLKRW